MAIVGIINAQIGNIGSIKSALGRLSIPHGEIACRGDFERFSHIILPGVGSFKQGVDNLHKFDLFKPLQETKKPVLGICLGMQLLVDLGHEGGDAFGLGVIPGEVKRLPSPKIPVIGWNTVFPHDFYFNHSYYVDTKYSYRYAEYDGFRYPATIGKGNFQGCQFHPEKSGKDGLKFLEEWTKFSNA